MNYYKLTLLYVNCIHLLSECAYLHMFQYQFNIRKQVYKMLFYKLNFLHSSGILMSENTQLT